MLLSQSKRTRLLKHWNKIFKSDITLSEDISDSDVLFNSFLSSYNKKQKYDYSENVCVCLKNGNKLNLYSSEDNRILFEEIGANTRKKFRNYINNYGVVITNFELGKDLIDHCLKINPKKQFLRYEILHSSYSGGKYNYLSDNVTFENENPAAYLTKSFISKLVSNRSQYEFVKYSSYLLNHFESGLLIDDIMIKPKINVSGFGRWYWTGKHKLQQDKELRNHIIERIRQSGDRYVSIDFISASPSMLSKLSHSKCLKQLVKNRIKHSEDLEFSSQLKDILNIIVHGNESLDILKKRFDYKFDISYLEKIGKFDFYSTIESLHSDLSGYNNNVIEAYKANLSFQELRRRLIDPTAEVEEDNDVIKKHRVYLQGHIHDNIILLTKFVYENIGIFPLYTIHDSVNFYLSKNENYERFIEAVKLAGKEIKLPFRIEEF